MSNLIPNGLSEYASRKLWNILSDISIQHYLKGESVAELARIEARKNRGQTKKVLLNIAALGYHANDWLSRFIDAMNEKNEDETNDETNC